MSNIIKVSGISKNGKAYVRVFDYSIEEEIDIPLVTYARLLNASKNR